MKYYRYLRKIQFGPLAFSALLVLILGLVLRLTMSLDPPKIHADSQSQQPNRAVASIESPWNLLQTAEPKAALPGPEELALDCSQWTQRPPFVSKSPFIRLELSGCEIEKVNNLRNDFVASIFPMGQLVSSTDFVSLAEGKNEIHIFGMTDSGPVDLVLEVIYQ